MSQHSAIGHVHFDASGTYRYSLERHWDEDGSRLVIIMLNPSQADHCNDDPTIRRCSSLARTWGFSHVEVVNLFAYRTPYPQQLLQVSNPVGPENDDYLTRACQKAEHVLLAWGNHGSLLGRDRFVLNLLKPFQLKFCHLGLNITGCPRHPLYVRRDAQLLPWSNSDE